MFDISVLLLALRKPLPFLELFYTHRIVHLKPHTDGDVSLSHLWELFVQMQGPNRSSTPMTMVDTTEARATLKSACGEKETRRRGSEA